MSKQLTAYVNDWFAYFKTMKPGMTEPVDTKKNPQLFIQTCKAYIDQGNIDFDFTNDYKYFRRINTWPVN